MSASHGYVHGMVTWRTSSPLPGEGGFPPLPCDVFVSVYGNGPHVGSNNYSFPKTAT